MTGVVLFLSWLFFAAVLAVKVLHWSVVVTVLACVVIALVSFIGLLLAALQRGVSNL